MGGKGERYVHDPYLEATLFRKHRYHMCYKIMHAAHSMLSSKELVCVTKIRVAFPHFRVARKPLGHMALRKVLGKREARIISRLRGARGHVYIDDR